MRKIIPLLILSFMSFSTLAGENYLGAGYSQFDYEVNGVQETANMGAVTIKLGSKINKNISGEFRAGVGMRDYTSDGVTLEVKNYFGAYIKAGTPFSESFYPYAIIGKSRGVMEFSYNQSVLTEKETDTSFGFGADFTINNSSGFNVEYINYLDKGETQVSGVSLGFFSHI